MLRRVHALYQRTLHYEPGDATLGQLVLHLENCGISAEEEYYQLSPVQHEVALALLPAFKHGKLEELRVGGGGLGRAISIAASPKIITLRVTIRPLQ
eukprot:SAG11_NODE_382_length_9923_cov_29.276771_7_plen_97_part_00